MTHIQTIDCLDLKQIADSGQCFRMLPSPAGGYTIVSRSRLLRVSQEGNRVNFDCPQEDLSAWLTYFDCATDYAAILASVDPDDNYLKAAAAAGRGIRILRQDPWEMIITFVISQQKTIPCIRRLVEDISRRWGQKIGDGDEKNFAVYSFPTPKELARASLEELLDLKLGYRAKYIHRLSQDAAAGILDLKKLETLEYGQAMEYLTGFYGIGKKVANCVCLFGLHHIEAFPVDTWIEKILLREYFSAKKYRRTPKNRLYDTILADHFGKYGGYAGVLQQYIFYYERLNQHKITP